MTDIDMQKFADNRAKLPNKNNFPPLGTLSDGKKRNGKDNLTKSARALINEVKDSMLYPSDGDLW